MISRLGRIERAYNSQKSYSKQRGIEFLFLRKDWVKWWEDNLGPEWFEKRGPFKHQYCMARFGDKGPYVLGNVKCITNAENNAEQVRFKGEKHGNAKLTKEQVVYIRTSGLKGNFLAKKFGVSKSNISLIKTYQHWK
jgi:hypothetical protein